MTDCSERISDDLHLAIENNYKPCIWLREYVKIPEWSEFRCFVKDNQLIGISQYKYSSYFPEIKKFYKSIEWAIEAFFENYFIKACHLKDVVFDVFVKQFKSDNTSIWEVKLIEINPFCVFTDPCLFEWKFVSDTNYRLVKDIFFKFVTSNEKEKEHDLEVT